MKKIVYPALTIKYIYYIIYINADRQKITAEGESAWLSKTAAKYVSIQNSCLMMAEQSMYQYYYLIKSIRCGSRLIAMTMMSMIMV